MPTTVAALPVLTAPEAPPTGQLSEPVEPDPLPEAFRRHGVIQDFEALQALGWEYANGRAALPPVLGAQLDRAQALSAAEYDDARRHAHRARRALKDLFSEYDALLTFSATGIAPGPETTGDPRFNRLWTLMGVPCVTLPVPGEALPVGVQVIARFGDDGRALAAARLIEAGLDCAGQPMEPNLIMEQRRKQ